MISIAQHIDHGNQFISYLWTVYLLNVVSDLLGARLSRGRDQRSFAPAGSSWRFNLHVELANPFAGGSCDWESRIPCPCLAMVWQIRKTSVSYSVGHVLWVGAVWAQSGCVVGIKRWACDWRSSIIGHTVGHSAIIVHMVGHITNSSAAKLDWAYSWMIHHDRTETILLGTCWAYHCDATICPTISVRWGHSMSTDYLNMAALCTVGGNGNQSPQPFKAVQKVGVIWMFR